MLVRKMGLLLLTVALAFAVAACGGDDKKTVDLPGGGQVDIGQDGNGITISGPSGNVNIGTADYPDAWPSDFPVPDGASPVYSVGAAGMVAVWFSTDASQDDTKAFFTSELPSAGYTIDSTNDFSDASGSYTVMSVTGNGWTGGIYMGDLGSVAAGYSGSDADFWVSLSQASTST